MSFLGSVFGGGPSNDQKQSNNLLNSSATQSIGNYGQDRNTGLGILNSGVSDFQAPTSYYSSILSGNPTSVSQAIAPQLSQLNAGYNSARNQADQFAPMGGGRASTIANMPFQKEGAITNLISGARQNAATGLTGIGTALGGIGLGEQGAANSELNTGTTAASDFNKYAQDQMQYQYGIGQDVGQGLGALITKIPAFAKAFGF